VALLVRSWNLYHGNASPPQRRSFLRQMVALATADAPDVLCLQEIPVWALGRIAAWSGMTVFPAVARGGLRPAALAGWLTRLHNGLLRSGIAGQANAILVRSDHGSCDLGTEQVSDPGMERRVCQAVDVAGTVLVANVHLSSSGHNQRLELERVVSFADARALPGETVVLAGDLNMRAARLDGFSGPGPGIDHVLVRGGPAGALVVWPEERRLQNGVVLSDHAPVELEIG
jgi:endonuclease/exonuclease/phosphatase family metal-dependent hydrolase